MKECKRCGMMCGCASGVHTYVSDCIQALQAEIDYLKRGRKSDQDKTDELQARMDQLTREQLAW